MSWPTMKDLEAMAETVPEVGAGLDVWKKGDICLETMLTGLCVLLARKIPTTLKIRQNEWVQALGDNAAYREAVKMVTEDAEKWPYAPTIGEVLRDIHRKPPEAIKRDLSPELSPGATLYAYGPELPLNHV